MQPVPLISDIDAAERALWLARFAELMPELDIRPSEQINDTDARAARVAIVANPAPEQLRRFPALRWVQSLWAGVEKMVQMPELARVPIVRMEDPELARIMAEAVLTWVLCLHRELPEYARQQRERIWHQRLYTPPAEREIGVLGTGNLGMAAIAALKAQGFRVSAWSRAAKQIDGVSHYAGEEQLPLLLASCDIVVVLLPLTPQTRGLLNEQRLALLRPDASLINFARAAIVDYDALLRQLDRGALRHAVLDVFDTEPLPASSPLWQHPAVTVLPHVSGPTDIGSASLIVRDNLRRYFDHGEIPAAVDYARGY
jgi:glyoxylate/hydroxypyruvate reductase A